MSIMTSRKRIAFIAPNWLGDAVMSLPLVGMLGKTEGVSLSVVAPELTARVYWGLDGIDQLVVLPKRDLSRGIASRYRFFRQTRPDAALLLPPSFSSALAPWLAGIGVRTGYATERRGSILTDAVAGHVDRDEHLSDNFLRLGDLVVRRLGLQVPGNFDTPAVRVAAGELAELERIMDRRGIPSDYAVVVPGATYGPAKSWPWERYRAVTVELSKTVPVVLAGTAAEKEMCARIAHGTSNGVYELAGETSLGTFLALLSRARVVVANDSGSPHLAASMGTSVIVLFGSTSPAWTAPQGPSVDVIRHPVACSPCFRKTCPTQLECFDGITVEAVVGHTHKRL